MEPRLEANRANWNDRVGIHTRSRFYNIDGWLRDAPGPQLREIEALGNVQDKTLVHLQCHFGMDTLRWARTGAKVTGVDFSPVAIEAAISLAALAGLSESSSFVCSNVYDAPEALSHEQFDIVYVNLGSLCWLPDVNSWGEVVTNLLAPGGTLYLHDVHPFGTVLDDSGERITYGYFDDVDNPIVSDDGTTYTDGGTLASTKSYEWNHSIGEIVMALIGRGLVLDSLIEHDWTLFQEFPWLIEDESGLFVIPDERPGIPLSFTILAHKPA
jgi:SAM-dependent methyltransferase